VNILLQLNLHFPTTSILAVELVDATSIPFVNVVATTSIPVV